MLLSKSLGLYKTIWLNATVWLTYPEHTTQKLLICPPQLRNVASLSWEKLITSFKHFGRCFLWCLGGSEKSHLFLCVDEDTSFEMDPYWGWSKWPPLVATQTVNRLVKFATALLMCSCGSSSQTVCKATFNSSVVLGFGWVYDTFPAWRSRCDSPVGLDVESSWVIDSSQWTQASSLAASLEWRAPYVLGRCFSGR